MPSESAGPCACVSIKPGVITSPGTCTTLASSGISTSSFAPTATMRLPSTAARRSQSRLLSHRHNLRADKCNHDSGLANSSVNPMSIRVGSGFSLFPSASSPCKKGNASDNFCVNSVGQTSNAVVDYHPKMDEVTRLAAHLGVGIDELFGPTSTVLPVCRSGTR